MKKFKSAAIITVFDAPNFSRKGRMAVVKWLRQQADFLQNDSKALGKQFRARYLYK